MNEKTCAQRESLRCLLASLASIEAMEWMFIKRRIDWELVNTREIDQRLANIRAFFVREWLDESEIQKHMPIIGPFLDHLMKVLFADAVRWWAAAHYSKQDKNKFLRSTMYKGDLDALYTHFYHWFRNNQLAHFPGGDRSNDNPFWVPTPYGFFLSEAEYYSFRHLLVNSIKITLGVSADRPDLNQLSENSPELKELIDQMPQQERSALESALAHIQVGLDEELLKEIRALTESRRKWASMRKV
ncbi:MAG: hypothetical protein OXI91_11665 [Chloroflexota bacterium]|nr:hypothetical protein [Chloroflexota bacterium]